MTWQNFMTPAELQVGFHLTLAMAAGGLLGLDREMYNKSAGLRTHMVVCVSSCLYVSMARLWILDLSVTPYFEIIRFDPTRIIVAIVTGISFVGAGSIIFRRDRNDVEGLTTAAILLMSAAVGICIAIEKYALVGFAVIINLFITQGVVWIRRQRQRFLKKN